MRALCFSESMELHRIYLRFEFMVVRLVAEGDALLPQLGQPFVVDLDTVGSGSRGVVPKNIAHVVEQPGSRQQNVGRWQVLLPFHAVKEVSGVWKCQEMCSRETPKI